MYMANEESAVAVTFSGEAAEMLENNEHLHYVIPSEGSNLWFDNIVMPKTAKNKEGAYAYELYVTTRKCGTKRRIYWLFHTK